MTPEHLKAIAGWALLKRNQDSAYGRLTDSAGEVADLEAAQIPEAVSAQTVETIISTQPPENKEIAYTYPEKIVQNRSKLPGILTHLPTTCTDGGEHRFAIQTQRCVYCSRTYKEVRQRSAELMETINLSRSD